MKKYRNLLIGVILSIVFSGFSIYYLNINELNFKITQYDFLSNALDDKLLANKLNFNETDDFNYEVSSKIKHSIDSIPILAYFSVSLQPVSYTDWIDIKNFEAQMDFLYKNGYNTLNSDELYSYIDTGVCDVVNPVVLTFDNGYKDFYDNAFPILKKYKFKAILFQITANVDELSNSLTSREIKEISDYGIDIGIRGNTNREMSELTPSLKDSTIKSGVDDLNKIINKNPVGFSFPYGIFDDGSIGLFNAYDIKGAFTLKNETVKKGQNLYSIPRKLINNNTDMNSFREFLKGIIE
ncbi:MAG: polysaccharide deacetylase family protein [Oscillospiraceae bacterium]|nr:polysaccharide deacetylase family protein [Oscillospiraceae bacterium]